MHFRWGDILRVERGADDRVLDAVQPDVARVIGFDRENLRGRLQVISAEERCGAGIGADAGVFEGASERQKLRLTGEPNTESSQVNHGFRNRRTSERAAEILYVQHLVVEDFGGYVGNARVAERHLGTASGSAGCTCDGCAQ